MASVSVYSSSFETPAFSIVGLDNTISAYDKFVFNIYQNNVCIISKPFIPPTGQGYYGFTLSFTRPDYDKGNWLCPACDYEISVDYYLNGVRYTTKRVSFGTDAIEPPTGTITPTHYVPIRDQRSHGTCVAESLASAMELFKEIETGIEYEQYSSAYIFGSETGNSNDSMVGIDAINNCIKYGSPRYEIFSGIMPDATNKATAQEMFIDADDISKNNALKQRFKSVTGINFYDCEAVANCIRTNGFYIFGFRSPHNWDNVSDNGIIPQPDEFDSGHQILLIGLTKINGKPHWIGQNSWGEDWGDGGRCYIPYDWGCGVQAPIRSNNNNVASWVLDGYSVEPGDGYTFDNPSAVYNFSGNRTDNKGAPEVYLSWSSNETGADYIILARQEGTEKWWRKLVTTDTTATISLDEYRTYEFMIITMKNSYCSPQSSVVTIDVYQILDDVTNIVTELSAQAILYEGSNGSYSYEIVTKFNFSKPYFGRIRGGFLITGATGKQSQTNYKNYIDESVPVSDYYNEDGDYFTRSLTTMLSDYLTSAYGLPLTVQFDGRSYEGSDGDYSLVGEFNLSCTCALTTETYPSVYSFNATQATQGNKDVYCDFYAYDIFLGISTYKICARQSGGQWYVKESGVLNDYFYSTTISTEEYGNYEFELTITTYDKSTTSNIVYVTVGASDYELNPKITSLQHYPERLYCLSQVDIEGATRKLYIKLHSETQWTMVSEKGLFGSRAWYFNDYPPIYNTYYDVKIVAEYNGDVEESDVVTMMLTELPTLSVPQNLTVSRIDKGFSVSWNKVSNATDYLVALDRNYDGESINASVSDNSLIINDALLENLSSNSAFNYISDTWANEPIMHYGVTYNIALQAYYKNEYTVGDCLIYETSESDWTSGADITTAPARPTITSVSANEGIISGNWSLVSNSNISYVYLTLYKSDGTELGTNYRITCSNLTSGTFSFPQVDSGDYIIKVASVLHLANGGVIWSVIDSGDDGSADNEDYRYFFVSDVIRISSGRPENWTWATAIKPGVYTLEGKNIVAVTATEWNAFTKRINEFRDYAASRDIPVGGNLVYAFTEVSPGMEFTKEIYNEAVDALNSNYNGISGYCGLINKISSGTVLTPSLFTIFEDEIAEIP